MPQVQAVAAVGQSTLIQTYEEAFAAHDLKVAQILLSHDDLAARERFVNAKNTLFTLLQWGVVPIINENDTVATDELKFGDNDHLARAHLPTWWRRISLILLTNTEGLYARDPREDPDAPLLTFLETTDPRLATAAGERPNELGTGGMVQQAPGREEGGRGRGSQPHRQRPAPGVLGEIFGGREVGTFFLPQTHKLSSRQYWLAYNVAPKGAILVDTGAREALVRLGKSLLPAGILEVFGGLPQGRAGEPHGPGRPDLRRGPEQLFLPGHQPHQGQTDPGDRPVPGPHRHGRSHPPGQPGDFPGIRGRGRA